MTYPVWDLGFAPGLLIAVVAVLHVFVSHFAIGGGLYLVLTETRARRRGDEVLLRWLHGHARFFLLLTLVFGAITGVGIWFTIGLVNPAGTSALIRLFVWGWAIEWVFFLVEIAAALVYWYGWDRLAPRTHLAIGWIYFAAAWLSLAVINGILTFQLTPGRWIETGRLLDAFFNPGYLPSLAARTAFALALAGLFSLVTAPGLRDAASRIPLVRAGGTWAVVGLVGTAVSAWWWWSAIPLELRQGATERMSNVAALAGAIPWLFAALALLVVAAPLAAPRLVRRPVAIGLLAIALVTMGAGEWLREAIRKPWIVVDYLWVNGIRPVEVDALRERGVVAGSPWLAAHATPRAATPAEEGERILRISCLPCHARTGYNGLASRVAGWDETFATEVVKRIEYLREPMPPWVGTDEEAAAVGAYLAELGRGAAAVPAAVPRGAPDRADRSEGAVVFARRCGLCHDATGFRDMSELVSGWTAHELEELLGDLESDYMPPFAGTDEERTALAAYLETLGSAPAGAGGA